MTTIFISETYFDLSGFSFSRLLISANSLSPNNVIRLEKFFDKYVFKVFALNTILDLKGDATVKYIMSTMQSQFQLIMIHKNAQ